MAGDQIATKPKAPNTVIFWKIIFPILCLVLLLFLLYVVFTIPDWALSDTCSSSLVRVQKGLSTG